MCYLLSFLFDNFKYNNKWSLLKLHLFVLIATHIVSLPLSIHPFPLTANVDILNPIQYNPTILS